MKDYTVENKVLVIKHVDEMVHFYEKVFDIDFQKEELDGAFIYTGDWGNLQLSLVPEPIAAIRSDENRMHYDVYVPSIEDAIEAVTQHGGRTNGNLGESETERAIGTYDPDGNFLVFKQRK